MTVSILVNKLDNCFVVHLLEPAIKRCFPLISILLADAEKCFDKVWLEDGLLELHKLGCSEKDVMMLFRLNHIANKTIKTPVGDTEDFTIMNVVKQGTTHGPIICCAETSQVNNGEESVKYQYEQVDVGVPVFMDDIMSAGDHDDVSKAVKSCRNMEKKTKKSQTV